MRYLLPLLILLPGCATQEVKPNVTVEKLERLASQIEDVGIAEYKVFRYLASKYGNMMTLKERRGIETYLFKCREVRKRMVGEIHQTIFRIESEQVAEEPAIQKTVTMFEDLLMIYAARFLHPDVPRDVAWEYIQPHFKKLKQTLLELVDEDGGVAQR